MRTVLIVVVSVALSSCQPKESAAPPAAASEVQPSSGATVTLNEAAQQKAHVVVESTQTKDFAQSLSAPGKLTVNEDQTWTIGAIASGKIDDLTVRIGDSVRAGQVVGHIHSHDVHEARADYQQASVELERARAAETYARQLRDRAQRLLELKAGSRQDVETAEDKLRNAQAAIDKAQSELAKERAHLTDILHVPIDPTGNPRGEEHDDIPIFAPTSGVVLQRQITMGSVVNAGDQLLTLSDTSSLWMIAAANELDLSKLRPGQVVRVQVRAYPEREFTGKILKLGEQLDPTTRTLQIRILVPNPQGLLKPEMYATAGFQEGSSREVLFLPAEAVQDINGVPVVFVRRSATEFDVRTVKTGRHVEGETEIVEGLNAGDAVVVKGSFVLKSELMRRSLEEE